MLVIASISQRQLKGCRTRIGPRAPIPDAAGELSSRTRRPSQVSWSMGLGRTSPVAKPRGVWGWLGIRAESCLHSEERRDFKVAHAHCGSEYAADAPVLSEPSFKVKCPP